MAQREASSPSSPDNTYFRSLIQNEMTGRTRQMSQLPLRKAMTVGDARGLGDVTDARPVIAQRRAASCRSRLPSRKWGHGSGARCSASGGPPPWSCTSTAPEGPGSASRPRPHPRHRRRRRRCRCSRTPSLWPRCLRRGHCGRVCAGRLRAATRAPAVPVYVGAHLRPHPAPDACDLSATQLGGRWMGCSGDGLRLVDRQSVPDLLSFLHSDPLALSGVPGPC